MTHFDTSKSTSMPDGWRGDQSPLMQRVGWIAVGRGEWLVLRAGRRLALALPKNRKAAAVVIGLYQPHRWTGRAFQWLARVLVFTGLRGFLAKIRTPQVGAAHVSWLKDAAQAGCVGFLGANPVHGPRCILGGIDPGSGEVFVAKLGLDESAASVEREHAALVQLHGKYPGVLESLGCETGDGWALLRLPHLGDDGPKRIGDLGVAELLHSWIGPKRVPLAEIAWAKRLLEQVRQDGAPEAWHAKLLARPVNQALVHGDFAVWNTRRPRNATHQGNGDSKAGLIALDWEWAEENGVAGVDLVHGLRQECYMVHRMKPAKAVAWMLSQASSPRWLPYLDACGWAGAHDDWLRLGLLHSHFNAKNDSAELLKELGLDIIPR